MEESTSREKVLKNIRDALISKTDPPYPKIDFEKSVYKTMDDPVDITFAQELSKASGNFIYCESETEFIQDLRMLISDKGWNNVFTYESKIIDLLESGNIPYISGIEEFKHIKVGISPCEFLIARLGSIMVSSAMTSGRRLNVFPDVHIVMAYTSQIVPDLKDALKAIRKRYENNMPSMISIITGPSRTADIEKTLVMGAHGPKELYVFLIEDRK